MAIPKEEAGQYLKNGNFRKLFLELGWDKTDKEEFPVKVEDQIFDLETVAQKRGFVVIVCQIPDGKSFPNKMLRRKIEKNVTRFYFEHLVIYTDSENYQQVWQVAIREPNQPIKYHEVEWFNHQDPERLYNRLTGLFIPLEQEGKIGLQDVKIRAREQFEKNTKEVTKQFYDGFKKQHTAFLDFIEGVTSQIDREWYTSLLLNRLMFIYFIQKKGFLDNDRDYLQNKLRESQQKNGEDKFYSFYRNFLLTLFHHGLGKPEHDDSLKQEIGQIPYLNGGLFDEHWIETEYQIQIPDQAFKSLFDFFDEFNWNLDTSEMATGRDINPDVIGYIFEKYINERAQMGAYYTKEDITEYISKNSILPWIFDKVKESCAEAFKGDSTLWELLRDKPERYIYDGVKKGINYKNPENKVKWWQHPIFDDLPKDVTAGLNPNQDDLIEKRKRWNRYAPEEIALPTEIYRELIERRKRYLELRHKLENGEIKDINDFITYNLDIRQFAQDAVREYEGKDFISAFHKAISDITVLDPTCGSGAFLFAALNILEPLYEECIDRMKDFVEHADAKGERKDKFRNFRKVLNELNKHPSERYFIYKSIILNNLYGVDIMKEAVETAKLRLFLKLVATVDHDSQKENFGLEPMPDIDFNIRSGNALVGYATYNELKSGLEGKIDFDNTLDKVQEKMQIVADTFTRFKEIQMEGDENHAEFREAKDELHSRLGSLNHELNQYLATNYGLTQKEIQNEQETYQQWLDSHQPCHWFAEFYEIIHGKGGFDVVIGNPPYVEYSEVKTKLYKVSNYKTLDAGNLYVYVMKNSLNLMKLSSRIGFIVQLPIVCTDRMIPAQKVLGEMKTWISTYDDRPGKLFDGLEHIRATIFLSKKGNFGLGFSTKYNRWKEEEREFLFELLKYNKSLKGKFPGAIPKIGDSIGQKIYDKNLKDKPLKRFLLKEPSNYVVYYHNAPQYFVRAQTFKPYFWNERDGEKLSGQVKPLRVKSEFEKWLLASVLNSNLFYWWFIIHSDCRHLNKREIDSFPFSLENVSQRISEKVQSICFNLMEDYEQNKNRKSSYYKTTGQVIYDEYFPKYSKEIIDNIDLALAVHYNLTYEELDFIINYDVKYRLNKHLERFYAPQEKLSQ